MQLFDRKYVFSCNVSNYSTQYYSWCFVDMFSFHWDPLVSLVIVLVSLYVFLFQIYKVCIIFILQYYFFACTCFKADKFYLYWEVLCVIFLCTLLAHHAFLLEQFSALCPVPSEVLYYRFTVLKCSWAISCVEMESVSKVVRNCNSLYHQALMTFFRTLEIHKTDGSQWVLHCTYVLLKF
jgi:hypothetical protein